MNNFIDYFTNEIRALASWENNYLIRGSTVATSWAENGWVVIIQDYTKMSYRERNPVGSFRTLNHNIKLTEKGKDILRFAKL